MANRRRLLIAIGAIVVVLVGIGGIVFLLKTSREFALAFSVSVILLILLSVTALAEDQRQKEELTRERQIANLTAQALAEQLGPHAELLSRATAEPSKRTAVPTGSSQSDHAIQNEVDRRVKEAGGQFEEIIAAELAAQRANSEVFDSRIKAIEDKFPDTEPSQRFADANQLFTTYQLSALSKRLDKIEERLLTRTQIAGIVLTTFIAAVGLVAALLGILKAFGVVH